MRIRYGYGADAMPHDTTYDVRFGYGTDTMRHDTIHWFVIVMAPYRLPPDRVREPIKYIVYSI